MLDSVQSVPLMGRLYSPVFCGQEEAFRIDLFRQGQWDDSFAEVRTIQMKLMSRKEQANILEINLEQMFVKCISEVCCQISFTVGTLFSSLHGMQSGGLGLQSCLFLNVKMKMIKTF